MVTSFSVRLPAAVTFRMRKAGVLGSASLAMVCPSPSMVIWVVMRGRPLTSLSIAVRVMLAVRVIVSASPLPLAVLIAAISSAASPAVKLAAWAVPIGRRVAIARIRDKVRLRANFAIEGVRFKIKEVTVFFIKLLITGKLQVRISNDGIVSSLV